MAESESDTSGSEFSHFFNLSSVLENHYMQMEQFGLFFKSIDWDEPWLIGLICFHVGLIVLTVVSRKKAALQIFLFLLMLTLIVVAEQLNQLGAQHWKQFSRHQYFDSQGMFISIVFSLPLLFNCMIMVANWLLISSQSLTSIRKLQLQQQMRRERKEFDSSSNSSNEQHPKSD